MDIRKLSILLKAGQAYGKMRIKDYDVSSREHGICAYLYFHNEVSQDKISKALMIDKATVAKILLKLEQRGFVRREMNPKNRRENIITLTKEGVEVISDVAYIYDEWEEKVTSCLSEEEKKAFEIISDKLNNKALEILEAKKNE